MMKKAKKINTAEFLKGLVKEIGDIWSTAIETQFSSPRFGRAAIERAVERAANILGPIRFGHWVDSDARLWGYLAVDGEEVYFLANGFGAFVVDPSKVEEARSATTFTVEVGA